MKIAEKIVSVVLSLSLLFCCFSMPSAVRAETDTTPEINTETEGGNPNESGNGGEGGDSVDDPLEGEDPKDPVETKKIGVVYDLSTNLRVRTGPGTTHTRLTHNGANVNLYNDHIVTILEEVPSDDSGSGDYAVWYKVEFDYSGATLSGYIPKAFVRIKEVVGEVTQDFEEMIADFPEDYKEALRELHLYYPQWKFTPMFIDLDWDYVIDQEAQPQSNYINADMPESHRSTLPGSYDWTTDTWVKRGKKYDASKEIISYYMDPRNFLDERYIFQFESLSYDPSVHTLSGVEQMIQKINFMKGKEIKNSNGEEISYAQAYMDAAEKSKVSPYHLVARTRQEVGVNGSESVSGTESGYKGIYNFYNIQATGSWKDGLEWASKSGTWGRPWNTQYKSVVNGADWIGSGYINKGQNTLYFEKFHVVGSDPNDLFWHQYMQTLTAPYSEASTIYSAYQDMGMLSSALSFIIPVYKNMPEEKCTKPTATGSPNNWLKTLEVEGHSITPSFECNGSTDYSLIVASNVAQIKVKATAVSDSAIINDGATRTIDLEMGTNTVNIRVRAGNGDIKTYVLTVVREEGGNIPEPPIGGEDVIPPGYEINSAYTVQNGKISGIEIGTTLEEIKNNLGLKGNATAAFYNADGSAITDETIRAATGITVKISAGAIDVFTLLVYGDANGDGEINAIDLLMVRRFILGTYDLKDVYFKAGDCNKDGEINAIDLLMVRRNILGSYKIVQ